MTENPTVLNINASMLRHLTMCRRRVWLDRHGDSGDKDAITPITTFRLGEGIKHEAQVHRAVTPDARKFAVQNWSEGVEVTQTLIRRGTRSIGGAYLEADLMLEHKNCILRVRGKVDRLQKLSEHPAGIQRYQPIEIKSYRTIGPADQLQLDCYLWLLRQIPTVVVAEGEFWLGQSETGEPKHKLQHIYDERRLFSAFEELSSLLLGRVSEPEVFLTHHCKRCQWYTACSKHAERVYDVSHLSGLRKDTHQDLKSAGIVSLNQIVDMPPEKLQKFRGIKSTALEFHSQAVAWVENRPVWCGELPGHINQRGWMFDLETFRTSLSEPEQIWSMGWGHGGQLFMAVIAPSRAGTTLNMNGKQISFVSDVESAWRLFLEAASEDDLPIFHWSPYDATILGKTASELVKNSVNNRFYDLHGAFKKAVKFPVDGTSLKSIASHLGFKWSGYDDYLMAYIDYKRWLETGNEQKFESFSAYLSDDIIALETLWTWMVKNAPLKHGSAR